MAEPKRWGEWTDGGVFTVLAFNLIISTVLLLVFSVFRRSKTFEAVFAPRFVRWDDEKTKRIVGSDDEPREYPRGFLAWIPATLKINDDEMLRECGLDSALFVLFERTVLQLLFFVCLVTAPILVPIHNSKDNNLKSALAALEKRKDGDPEVTYTTGFNNWTVKNVPQGDPVLWVHLVVFVLISIAIYVAAARLTLAFYTIRKKFKALTMDKLPPDQFTVMIRNLPTQVKSEDRVVEYLDELYPNQVLRVHLVQHLPKLLDLQTEYANAKSQYEMYDELKRLYPDEKSEVKVGGLIPVLCGKKVDPLEHYRGEMRKLESKIATEKEKLPEQPMTRTAFVTFKNSMTAKHCAQNFAHRFDVVTMRATSAKDAVISPVDNLLIKLGVKGRPPSGHVQSIWAVSLAHHPDLLIWNNFVIPPALGLLRRWFLTAFTVVLTIFWSLPVAFLGSLQTLGSIPGFNKLLNLPPIVLGFLSSYLPVIVLVVFNALLPMILTKISIFEGTLSLTVLYRKVLVKFFTFTLFSVIIIPAVAIGTISKIATLFTDFSSNPFRTVMDLITSITSPQTGAFVAYMVQIALVSSAVSLLNLGSFLLGKLKYKRAKTERQKRESYTVPPFLLHLVYSMLLLLLCITLFFCLAMPITTPFGLLAYLTSFVTHKYRLYFMSCNLPPLDGYLFPTVIKLVLVIQVIFQFGAAGLFLSRLAYGPFGIAVFMNIMTFFLFAYIDELSTMVYKDDLFIGESEEHMRAAGRAKAKLGDATEEELTPLADPKALEEAIGMTKEHLVPEDRYVEYANAFLHPGLKDPSRLAHEIELEQKEAKARAAAAAGGGGISGGPDSPAPIPELSVKNEHPPVIISPPVIMSPPGAATTPTTLPRAGALGDAGRPSMSSEHTSSSTTTGGSSSSASATSASASSVSASTVTGSSVSTGSGSNNTAGTPSYYDEKSRSESDRY